MMEEKSSRRVGCAAADTVLGALEVLCFYAAQRLPLSTSVSTPYLSAMVADVRIGVGQGDDLDVLATCLYSLIHARHRPALRDERELLLDRIRRDLAPSVAVVADWYRDRSGGEDPPWLRELTLDPARAWQGSYRSRWRARFAPVIAEVLATTASQSPAEQRAALRDAYPLGERRNWPYKVWLDEIARQQGRKPPLGTRRTGPPPPTAADGQIGMFGSDE